MKNLVILIVCLCFSLSSYGQSTPRGMKYQAVARDADGVVIADKELAIKMSLLPENERTKGQYYTEIHDVRTNKFGLFELTVGEGIPIVGEFNRIPWSKGEVWLEMSMEDVKSGDFEVLSSNRLLTVPYAFHALTAEQLSSPGSAGMRSNDDGIPSNVWSLKGNKNVNGTVDKLGTTDCADLVIVTDNQERMRILCSGAIEMVGDLSIGGNTTLNGTLEVSGISDFSNINATYLTVGINAYLQALQVEDNAIIYNDLNVGNNIQSRTMDIAESITVPYLTVYENAYLQALEVEDNAIIYNDLDVGNNIQSNSLDVAETGNFKNVNVAENTKTSTLEVTGSATTPYLTVSENTFINTLQATGDAELYKNLTVSETTKSARLIASEYVATPGLDVANSANIGFNLSIQNDADVKRDLFVRRNANIEGDLNVTGNTNFSGPLVSSGPGAFNNINVANNTSTGTLNVAGSAGAGSIQVAGAASTGALTVNGSSSVSGSQTIGQDASVGGQLTVSGNASSSSLNVSGATTTQSLNVSGNSSFNTIATQNNANIGQDLIVSRNISAGNNIASTFMNASEHINAGLDLTAGRNLIVANNIGTSFLNVSDNANVSENLTVNGMTSLQELTVNEDMFTGNLTVQDKLSVANNASFNSDLSVQNCLSAGTNTTANFKFTPSLTNSNENNFANYPLQIAGGTQGIAIDVNGWFQSRNYMAFFADGTMRGRIEGKNGFLFQGLDQNAQALVNYNGTGTPEGTDGLDPNTGASEAAQESIPSTPHPSVSVNTEELVDYILLATEFLGAGITLASSFTSVLDPFDIFEAALGLAISIADIGVFVGFGFANVGVAYESGSGDYAEWLEKEDRNERMSFGDVVGVIGGKVSKDYENAEKFMVISAAPAVIGAMPEQVSEEVNYEKVAFIGQVPVKVKGHVEIGDYILPSGEGDGLAIAVSKERMKAKDYSRIVGVAWQASKKEDTKKMYHMINTAVGINQNDIAGVVDQMQLVMNQMQSAIQEMNPAYEGFIFDTNAKEITGRQDISLASYHDSNMRGYFDGKTFETQEELGQLVVEALETQAGLDLNEYPLVRRMLLEPAFAEQAKAHYTKVLDEHLQLMKELQAD